MKTLKFKKWAAIVLLAVLPIANTSAEDRNPKPKASLINEKCTECNSSPIVSQYTETKWVALSDRKRTCSSEIVFTTQDGVQTTFGSLFDRPAALTFLYTRCSNPKKCPLVAKTMADLQNAINLAGLKDKIRLCIMTYDPEYDTPQILKAYASEHGLNCNEGVMFLRSTTTDKNKIYDNLNVVVNYDDNHVSIHRIQLLLLDSKGRVAKSYQTVIWNNDRVLDDLKALLVEDSKN